MSERLGCEAPAVRFGDGTTRQCTNFGHRWQVSKDGQSKELIRCSDHAAKLRENGYDVHKGTPKAAGQAWDMRSTNSLEAGAAWLRKQSGALAVYVVRADDSVIVLEKGYEPGDVGVLLQMGAEQEMQRLTRYITEQS